MNNFNVGEANDHHELSQRLARKTVAEWISLKENVNMNVQPQYLFTQDEVKHLSKLDIAGLNNE